MAERNFDQIMSWLAVYEGGKVDDPDDPGGRTNRGVTQRVYTAYRKANGKQPKDVWLMSDDEHDDIYLEQYWRPVWGDRLRSGVDASLFDMCVHSGARKAVRTAQEVVGVTADGIMGNVTFAAIEDYCNKHGAVKFLIQYNDRRLAFLKRLKVWWKYKNGWTRRVIGDKPGAQDGDFGVVDRSVMLTGTTRDVPMPKAAAPGKADGPEKLIAAIIQFIAQLLSGLGKRRTA